MADGTKRERSKSCSVLKKAVDDNSLRQHDLVWKIIAQPDIQRPLTYDFIALHQLLYHGLFALYNVVSQMPLSTQRVNVVLNQTTIKVNKD